MTKIFEKLNDKLTFRKFASFKSMIKGNKNYENIDKIVNYINSLEDEKAKAKLIKQAKHYFSGKFNMPESHIFMASEIEKMANVVEVCTVIGDVEITKELVEVLKSRVGNIKYLVGDLSIPAEHVELKYLTNVYGDVKLGEQAKLYAEKLEEITGSLIMPNNKYTTNLPVVKVGKKADLSNSAIRYLMRLTSVGKSLNLRGSDIKYIPSLIYPGSELFDLRDTNIEKLPKEIEFPENCVVYTTPHDWTSEN